MPKPDNQFQALARDAAERIAGDRDLRQQLSLLPDEGGGAVVPEDRPVRGRGKATTQLREWLAVRGHRLPEDVLVQMAGLAADQPADAVEAALVKAERILAWAEAGAVAVKGAPAVQTIGKRLEVFQLVYSAQLRAAEALLPYGAPKATPDAAPAGPTVLVVPSSALDQAAQARDVTPVEAAPAGRMRPPPMPWEMQQNQGDAEGAE